jgi:hypothetical protein
MKGRTIELKSSKVTRTVPKDLKPWRDNIKRDSDLSIEEKRLRNFSKSKFPKFKESAQREG